MRATHSESERKMYMEMAMSHIMPGGLAVRGRPARVGSIQLLNVPM